MVFVPCRGWTHFARFHTLLLFAFARRLVSRRTLRQSALIELRMIAVLHAHLAPDIPDLALQWSRRKRFCGCRHRPETAGRAPPCRNAEKTGVPNRCMARCARLGLAHSISASPSVIASAGRHGGRYSRMRNCARNCSSRLTVADTAKPRPSRSLNPPCCWTTASIISASG